MSVSFPANDWLTFLFVFQDQLLLKGYLKAQTDKKLITGVIFNDY